METSRRCLAHPAEGKTRKPVTFLENGGIIKKLAKIGVSVPQIFKTQKHK
jgi:hypothetical protein